LRHAAQFWNVSEREEFVDYIAKNPEAGDVIQGTSGLRKVRYARAGMGKSGGVRIIYLLQNERGQTLLLAAYTKNQHDTLSKVFLQALSNIYKG
jgi:hypothetical protein